MLHFVQYHNSEGMGISCLDFPQSPEFYIYTSKVPKDIIDNRVWLVGGIGKPRKYYLVHTFLAAETRPSVAGSKKMIVGTEGQYCSPAILLSDLLWFTPFLKSQLNFSLGLRKIDGEFIAEFAKLVDL